MKKQALFVAVLAALAGCAQLKQGLKDAAEGIKPAVEIIPEGPGWSCYVATERTWSGCWRTADDCNAEREKNKVTFAIDTLTFKKWSSCSQALSAWCMTYEKNEIQADGTGKMVQVWECLPDELSCGEFITSMQGSGNSFRVSTTCAKVD